MRGPRSDGARGIRDVAGNVAERACSVQVDVTPPKTDGATGETTDVTNDPKLTATETGTAAWEFST